jgi:hypothetical protein
VFEFCNGGDLAAWYPGKPWREIASRLIEAGKGLARIHAAGYVHGDVKPHNILIHDGVAKLADFGTAIHANRDVRLIGGTPGYLSAHAIDHRPTTAADVYALAFTAWECLFAGARPFEDPPEGFSVENASTFYANRAFERAFVDPPVPADMPRECVRLLQAALRHEPDKRPSLVEFLRELKWIRDQPVGWRWVSALAFPGGRPTWTNVVALGAVLCMGAWGGFTCAPKPQSSLLEAYMRSQDPLVRAEIAAKIGDSATAISALSIEVRGDSPPSDKAISAAERVANALESNGAHNDADVARGYVRAMRRLQRQYGH